MNRTPIRKMSLALAAVATTTGIALGVNAMAEPEASAVSGLAAFGPMPSGAAVMFPVQPVGHQLGALKDRQAAYRTKVAREQAAAARLAKARASRDAARSTVTSSGDPRAIARSMLAARGWSSQWSCLDSLWSRESGWNVHASNPSGAYGIPQALPGSKMSTAGSDWRDNAATQIRWGLGYIASSYGGPCAAWSHSQSTGWY